MIHLLDPEKKDTLHKFVLYYTLLEEEQKKQFEIRLAHFLKTKEFRSARGMIITEEVKVIISSIAIKMTFGLEKYLLPHFRTIIIYPDAFFSPVSNDLHAGEVNTNGAIAFSWRNIVEGLMNPTDSYNIGVHEFAHAIFIENFIENDEYLFIDPRNIKRWHEEALPKMLKLRSKIPVMIRENAGQNIMEFFAVTSEYFFEVPFFFREKFPNLYKLMKEIYNQDMTEVYKEENVPE